MILIFSPKIEQYRFIITFALSNTYENRMLKDRFQYCNYELFNFRQYNIYHITIIEMVCMFPKNVAPSVATTTLHFQPKQYVQCCNGQFNHLICYSLTQKPIDRRLSSSPHEVLEQQIYICSIQFFGCFNTFHHLSCGKIFRSTLAA